MTIENREFQQSFGRTQAGDALDQGDRDRFLSIGAAGREKEC